MFILTWCREMFIFCIFKIVRFSIVFESILSWFSRVVSTTDAGIGLEVQRRIVAIPRRVRLSQQITVSHHRSFCVNTLLAGRWLDAVERCHTFAKFLIGSLLLDFLFPKVSSGQSFDVGTSAGVSCNFFSWL